MTTLSQNSIASWPSTPLGAGIARDSGHTSIATTTENRPSPQWHDCLNAVLDAWCQLSQETDHKLDGPSRETLEAAMQWLISIRESFPHLPPTSISPEPAGGLIIERCDREIISELTLYNDRRAEMTYYANNKVVEMIEVPFNPVRPEVG
jgi:hypothetical protein